MVVLTIAAAILFCLAVAAILGLLCASLFIHASASRVAAAGERAGGAERRQPSPHR